MVPALALPAIGAADGLIALLPFYKSQNLGEELCVGFREIRQLVCEALLSAVQDLALWWKEPLQFWRRAP